MLPRSLLRAYPRALVRYSNAASMRACARTMSSISDERAGVNSSDQPEQVQPTAEGTLMETSPSPVKKVQSGSRRKAAADAAEENSDPAASLSTEEAKPKRSSAKRLPKADATTTEPVVKRPMGRPRKPRPEGVETKPKKAPKPPKIPKPPKAPRKLLRGETSPVVHGDGVELPPPEQWRVFFPDECHSFKRATTRNPETAKLLAEALVPEGSKDLVIVEANPGPGQLTRALLALPRERIRKIILIDDVPSYLHYLHALEKIDDRVNVVPAMAKQWVSYLNMEELGLMNDVKVQKLDEGVHPNLRCIMHISADVHGDQFVSQLLRTIPDRQWLFKYGRVPLHLIVLDKYLKRIAAPAGASDRTKAAVMCEATAHVEAALPFEALQPYSQHFYPNTINKGGLGAEEDLKKQKNSAHSAITVIPHEHPAIEPGDLDYWDYCLRKMFVLSTTPLEKSISALGPGAFNLLPKLADPSLPEEQRLDINKFPKALSLREWGLVINAFKKWPFRPQDLSIEGYHTKAPRENNNTN